MPLLLLEIGCEELPAGACREAERQLPELCRTELGREPAQVFVGPRRLAVLVDGVAAEPEPVWVKGPPVALRDRAAAGFAKRHGVAVEELEEREGFLGVEAPGRSLLERIDGVVDGLAFGKSMVWEAGGRRFSRPVRWICAKLDEETLVGGSSFGHRFVSGRLEIPSAAAYAEVLREAQVEPDADARRRLILDGLPEGWKDPLRKLEEVVYLAEWPTVLEGTFDERFLRLPRAVIETAMQSHQRYFPLDGSRFAFVANGGDPDVVRAGNENVLNSRLEDAEFSFERDLVVGIDGLAGRLDTITFFAGAGTYADKTSRIVELAERLGGDGHAILAAQYAKADQASELVKEFPELEGHIGAEYARLAGLADEVCTAVDEHFLPDSAGGPLPSQHPGRVVAAADKIDTLNVSFGLGQRPTGSRDPYGLRRAAIGLCRLAREGGLPIPLDLLADEVAGFVEERLDGLLDVPVEFVRAARTADVADLGSVAQRGRGAGGGGRLGRVRGRVRGLRPREPARRTRGG